MRNQLIAAAIAAAFAASAARATAGDVTVDVTHVRNAAGDIELCLWAKPDGFPDCTDRQMAKRVRMKAAPGTVSFHLGDVVPGTYGISLYHDEKNLGHIDTNFVGIPRTGVGASHDARGRIGPPSFTDAAFVVAAAPQTLSITMTYP